MRFKNPFKDLTKFELGLWLISVTVIIVSFAISGGGDILTIIASLIGVTALIFVAKGYVIGQILTVVFAVFYGIISYYFRYYGEMITYLCMTAPIAVMAVVSWLRNPYEGTKEVKISHVTKNQVIVMSILTVLVTLAFYFILKAMGTANLLFSTISITTSFVASYLTFLRSPYYAVAYSANDKILIVLWTMATLEDVSYLPMICCFVMFLINDMYGFFNWRRMRKRQDG
ncbi:MAG: nicotinamide mononucleotide transporter [Lachnospiraceae bacterium]|nr:nicotinamide mononucleotide transporter [Lachnospiraceae bacterium]